MTFAQVILDRLYLLSGNIEDFSAEVIGLEHIATQVRRGRGCLILGAHFGSFELLRLLGDRDCPVPFQALMFRRHSGTLTRMLQRLKPALAKNVIEVGTPDAMLRLRDAVEAGHVVGILADRAPESPRRAVAEFLGKAAEFPTGPMIVAATLGAPVVLAFAVRTGHRRYTIHIEPFADRLDLTRATRKVALQRYVASYADRLGIHCRRYPYNWFNFYEFWRAPISDEPACLGDRIVAPGCTSPTI